MAAPVTASQIAIVKATAPVLKEHGNAITSLFYKTLIEENPGLRNVFSMTSQESGRQPRALAASVLAYATYIDDLPKLAHAVERIAQKHVSLQVTPELYDVVGTYLMRAIGEVLGAAATPDIVDAWTAAYGALASVFINREGDLYKANIEQDSWPAWRKFKVAERVTESDAITSFYLTPTDGVLPLPRFLPGQYVSVQLFVPQLGHLQSRQYSLSQAPRADGAHYRISVKKEEGAEIGIPGLISNMLHETLQVGSEIEMSHPQGEFFVDPSDASTDGVPAVLISAGVGATPLVSILDSLTSGEGKVNPQVTRPVSWIHVSSSSNIRPFHSEVESLCSESKNVTRKLFLGTIGSGDNQGVNYDFEGRLDLSKVDQEGDLFVGNSNTQYYLCGPEKFMVDVRRALADLGVGKERIHMELFETGDVADE
jgi:nitric oxide dioxygenase